MFGLIGVVLIVIGSYVLNIKRRNAGYLALFKAMLEQRWPRLMLYAAFILSITSSIDKIGVLNSSPLF